MPKPTLRPDLAALETEMIKTFLAGHHAYRADLAYPESHSDLQAGMRALLKRFDIQPRAIPLDWNEMLDVAKER